MESRLLEPPQQFWLVCLLRTQRPAVVTPTSADSSAGASQVVLQTVFYKENHPVSAIMLLDLIYVGSWPAQNWASCWQIAGLEQIPSDNIPGISTHDQAEEILSTLWSHTEKKSWFIFSSAVYWASVMCQGAWCRSYSKEQNSQNTPYIQVEEWHSVFLL